MKQYSIKHHVNMETQQETKTRLLWRTEAIYKKLDTIYGTQGLIMKASKFDAIELMSSPVLQERVLALSRILKKNPTLNDRFAENQIPALLDELEELLIENFARRKVEN